MPSKLPGRSMRTMRKRAPRSIVSPSRSVVEGISDARNLSAELPGDTWLAVEDVYDTAGERPLSWSPRSAVDSEGSRVALGPLAGELVLAIPYPIAWAKGKEVKCGDRRWCREGRGSVGLRKGEKREDLRSITQRGIKPWLERSVICRS